MHHDTKISTQIWCLLLSQACCPTLHYYVSYFICILFLLSPCLLTTPTNSHFHESCLKLLAPTNLQKKLYAKCDSISVICFYCSMSGFKHLSLGRLNFHMYFSWVRATVKGYCPTLAVYTPTVRKVVGISVTSSKALRIWKEMKSNHSTAIRKPHLPSQYSHMIIENTCVWNDHRDTFEPKYKEKL